MTTTNQERGPWPRRTARRRPYVPRLPSALSRSLRDMLDTRTDHVPPIDHREARERLARDGVVAIEGVLEPERCARVHRELLRQLSSRARPELGNIHGKDQRFDLPLRMTGAVADALVTLTARLGPTLVPALGPDARLVELSALQALPGAPEQPPHPDAGGSDDPDEARLVTVFVLLVDVTADRGPLEVWPGTHVRPGKPDDPDHGGALRQRPSRLMTAPAGTAVLMDARTWHRGTTNTGPLARPVFYASWLSTGTRPHGPTWTMHDSIPPSLTLSMLTRHS